jgi:hypothetical protein
VKAMQPQPAAPAELRLITADERLATAMSKNTAAVFGLAGVGKTRLAYSLPAETTLCLDIEAGLKSVDPRIWRGASVEIATWPTARHLACLLAGPNPAKLPHEPYSIAHYEHVLSAYGRFIDPSRFQNLFVDSITVLSRICFAWARQQPDAFNKHGKPDTRGAYGLLAREFVEFLTHLQHAKDKNTIFVGGLQRIVDDFQRETWEPQVEGGRIAKELPFIFDQVITLSRFDYNDATGWVHNPEKGLINAFVCKQPNPWGLPGKTRGDSIHIIEEPHLWKLFEKINRQPALTAPAQRLALPAPALQP